MDFKIGDGGSLKEISSAFVGHGGQLKEVNEIYVGDGGVLKKIYPSVLPIGQVEWTTPGSYTWTVPEGVTEVSAVVVGAGGGGCSNTSGTHSKLGGSGGALAYRTFAVTPSEVLNIEVGAGGLNGDPYGQDGGDSTIKRGSTILVGAGGGKGGQIKYNGEVLGGTVLQGTGGDGGKTRSGKRYGGGGGAGGYSGDGGATGTGSHNDSGGTIAGQSGDGGAGGGGVNSRTLSGSGGGVGIYGEGSSGAGGNGTTIQGGGGSSGGDGTDTLGGLYGGGGRSHAPGGSGAARIIWGDENTVRAYPSTNTQDM